MTPAILREICIRTARTGNTTALAEFAKAHGAVVIVDDRPEAERVNRLGARAVSISGGLMAFMGSTRGYVVDMPVLQRIANAWDADCVRANDAAARAEGMEDHIAAWKARAEAAESDLRRYREHLDDIRCAILDTGHPLGDDSDTELTPLRLVKEVLAKATAAEVTDCGRWLYPTVESVAPKPEPIGPFHALQAVYEDGGKCSLRVTTTAGTTIFRSADDGATWTIASSEPEPERHAPQRR